ncbi:MAG: IS1 family transposase [Candidatus Poribacteria bacterium]|nr:IS1 family transposase [Candidatus Poribacteria bacterium]
MSCPRCQHPHFVKNGHIDERQRYKCKDCNYQWIENPIYTGRPLAEKALAVFLYCDGLSMNAIAKMLQASPSTILDWIRNFAGEHAKPPQPQEATAVVLELDEMWHYVNKKKKLWIWKALCRDTGELIGWECGDRDKGTLEKLIEKLEKWNVKVYYTDEYQAYAAVIPEDMLVQTKTETHGIERNNCRMRHWFGRFKRKSIIVSKSVEMVNLTIALFARFRVNGDVFDILKIGKAELNIIS